MYLFGDCLDFSISPDPEFVSFLLDVDDDGLSDKLNLESGIFFESTDQDNGLFSDLVNLNLDINIHIKLELDDDIVGDLGDSVGFD